MPPAETADHPIFRLLDVMRRLLQTKNIMVSAPMDGGNAQPRDVTPQIEGDNVHHLKDPVALSRLYQNMVKRVVA